MKPRRLRASTDQFAPSVDPRNPRRDIHRPDDVPPRDRSWGHPDRRRPSEPGRAVQPARLVRSDVPHRDPLNNSWATTKYESEPPGFHPWVELRRPVGPREPGRPSYGGRNGRGNPVRWPSTRAVTASIFPFPAGHSDRVRPRIRRSSLRKFARGEIRADRASAIEVSNLPDSWSGWRPPERFSRIS